MTGARVTNIDADGLSIGEERIDAGTVVWAAGVMASAAGRWLQADRDRAGHVIVGGDLTVEGADNIFVVGDTAASDTWDGNPVPVLAPAAKQGGAYADNIIVAKLSGKRAPGPFKYKHGGSLATIGRSAAVADFGRIRLSGAPAWWPWSIVHVLFLTSARSRFAVAMEWAWAWAWAFLTFRRSTRSITGG